MEEPESIPESKEIVVPGETLSEDPKMFPGRGALRQGNKIISIFIGLKDIRGKYVNVVPLRGLFTPEVGDTIIGKVVDQTAVKWIIDINGKEEAILKPADAVDHSDRRDSRYGNKRPSREEEAEAMGIYKGGDLLICKVLSADRVTSSTVTTIGEGLGKISDGICIQIDVPKIPRIIGKKGSMIKLLKDLTGCRIFVSKNGRIWVRGKNEKYEKLIIDTIRKIEREAHTTGLTDRIQYYIIEEKKARGLI
jgi:exosome complex component RRP4